ncbi:O-antigen ligase family protein [Mixta sp. Marseille-Q2659]|uniref:O-antigen ligase family protein n=1 Tax=Mixta sp. Marseille-Q2659 TaxID=2736607 RepID=UPI0023B9BE98|nr:O-antigen ligase family protein [Mixta sp. Marseille-Q2659]
MTKAISSTDKKNDLINANRWRDAFYFLALSTVLLAVMFTFIHEKTAKVTFYWAFYFSIIGIIFNGRKLSRNRLWFTVLLALLGCSKVIWFYWHYMGNADFNPFNDYLNAGKRLLFSSVISYYLFSQRSRHSHIALRMIEWGFAFAFIGATLYGLYQYFSDAGRVEFALDRATISAYGYAMLAAALIFMLAMKSHTKEYLLLCLGIFITAWFIIIQTGTRNMIAAFPVIILFVGLLQFRHLGWKAATGMFIAVAVLATACYKPMIKPRLDKSMAEYSRYSDGQGNKNGSLTSRLAMWNIGTACFLANPLGMNMEQRADWFKHYVEVNHRDASALQYVNIHLHNELIDTATLQGIQGVFVIVLFYLAIMFYALRKNNALLLSVISAVVVSGLTDVVFISRELTVCVSLLLILCVMWQSLTVTVRTSI